MPSIASFCRIFLEVHRYLVCRKNFLITFIIDMTILLKVILGSVIQALSSLRQNKLRTALSLLGISIGIFCVIAVLSAVNSLESSIKSGLGELGSDVIMIDVFPFGEDPGDNYWKYLKRPSPSYNDYEAIKKNVHSKSAAAMTIYVQGRTIKYQSSSVDGAFIMGTTYDFPEVQNMDIVKGRYFTNIEAETGANKVILGHTIATELFQSIEPVGKYVKLFGQKFQVIGVLKEEGDNPFNMINYDEATWISYKTASKFIELENSNRFDVGKIIYVKLEEGKDMDNLKGEITSVLRSKRRLRPREEDNFSLNEISMLDSILDSVFGVLYIAGGFIGVFALIVGMISVANIMFVSVKERTNIIGIKKALGAKNGVILLEFLIESIILCLIGGFIGLLLVAGVLKVVSQFTPFEIKATLGFMMFGVFTSVVVGIIAGFIPAFQASRLDPVEAMRH